MPDLPAIVKAAQNIHSLIAADLTAFGGILRCSKCHREQPLGEADIASNLRHGWPRCCGETMIWVTQRQLAAENWGPIPDGCELVAVPADGWRIDTGQRCRRASAGRKACGRPSVASLERGTTRKQRWAYCIDHLYGRWIEDGQVMHWILRETREN